MYAAQESQCKIWYNVFMYRMQLSHYNAMKGFIKCLLNFSPNLKEAEKKEKQHWNNGQSLMYMLVFWSSIAVVLEPLKVPSNIKISQHLYADHFRPPIYYLRMPIISKNNCRKQKNRGIT